MYLVFYIQSNLDSHDGACFDVEHFIDAAKITASYFTQVVQVFGSKVENLQIMNLILKKPFSFPIIKWCNINHFWRYLKFAW